MKRAALFGWEYSVRDVYGGGRRERVASLTDLRAGVVTPDTLTADLPDLRDIEVIFATWGMACLRPAQLAALPRLRAVFYAAGTVQDFAAPLLDRDVVVVSAYAANAIPTAEFATAQILLAMKNYWGNARAFTTPAAHQTAPRGPGIFGGTVALLGAGAIGRRVIEFLRPFSLRVIVFDPFLPQAEAARLGVEKVSLEDAFATAQVVSNHLANNEGTRHLITGSLLERLRPHATFINTGRGATVDEAGLIAVLSRRPDLTALLDVTDPEPPAENSPLYSMPNVQLTTHIAGSLGDEVVRLADLAIEEFEAWESGRPLRFAVTRDMLATMA